MVFSIVKLEIVSQRCVDLRLGHSLNVFLAGIAPNLPLVFHFILGLPSCVPDAPLIEGTNHLVQDSLFLVMLFPADPDYRQF